MKVKEIFDLANNLLARYIPSLEAWNEGLNFFSHDTEFLQVGTWVYENGKELKAHIHNKVNRDIGWTQELLFINEGSVLAKIFDSKGTEIQELKMVKGDLLILIDGGHGYKILEDNTKVLEVKNGPYLGPEVDRKRI